MNRTDYSKIFSVYNQSVLLNETKKNANLVKIVLNFEDYPTPQALAADVKKSTHQIKTACEDNDWSNPHISTTNNAKGQQLIARFYVPIGFTKDMVAFRTRVSIEDIQSYIPSEAPKGVEFPSEDEESIPDDKLDTSYYSEPSTKTDTETDEDFEKRTFALNHPEGEEETEEEQTPTFDNPYGFDTKASTQEDEYKIRKGILHFNIAMNKFVKEIRALQKEYQDIGADTPESKRKQVRHFEDRINEIMFATGKNG